MAPPPPYRASGNGPPIVLLHGWTMDGSIFDDQIDRLSGRFLCVAPDMPGHGNNRDDQASVEAAAAALRDLVEHLDLNAVTLVGWSMGAAIAWRFIGDFGSWRLARLMTVDMSPKMINDDGWTFGLKGQDAESCHRHTQRFRNNWEASAPSIAAGMFATRNGPVALPHDLAVERIRDNDPTAMASMWESLLAADAREAIADLDIPLLATHGARSRVYPAGCAQWLSQTAPAGRLHTFTNSGHSPHLEEPESFSDQLAAFAATPVTA